MAEGIVYILTNQAMPGYVKVGLTENDLTLRIKQLDTTSVPLPFECFYAARVEDCKLVERLLHDAFDDMRVRANREFFQIDPERVRSALMLAAIEEITPTQDEVIEEEGREAIAKVKRRKPTATFEMVGIEPGAVLYFIRDSNITCTVIDAKHVELNGEQGSLSRLTLSLLHDLGYDWSTCNGWAFWTYQGRKLGDYYQDALQSI